MVQFIQKDGIWNPITKRWDDHLGFFLSKNDMGKILEALEKHLPDDELTKKFDEFYMRFDRIKMPEA